MGIHANVVTKYVCEYEGSSAFNYEAERVKDMLTENGIDVYHACCCGGDCTYGNWEINVSDKLYDYIAKLGELPPDEVNEHFDADNVEHQEYTNRYIKDILEEWLSYSENGSGVIRIHWF